ncbi:MAG: cytochrome c3 family protein [Gammaproteobacteria bacterium]|nr:cytochrome c3 family protein [Gammaproteobacteria bacterium]
MNRMLSLQGWLLLTGIVAAAVSISVATGNRPFHPNLECISCHLAGAGVDKANAHQLTTSQEVLCGQCHRGALELSHPSGFAPNGSVSEAYPLDWKGDMTCSTCHDIHQGKPGLIRGTLSGKAFCLSCHDQKFFDQMADSGGSIQRRGHLSVAANPVMRDLDTFSIQCLECHMASGDAPKVNINERGVLRHAGGSVNHPVGVNYARAEQNGVYRPTSQLRAGIKLPQG